MSETHRLLLLRPPSGPPVAAMSLDHTRVEVPEEHDDEGFYERNRRRVYSAYRTLKDRLDYQERICSALRHTEPLEVHHAAGLAEPEAREIWEDYLSRQASRHRFRLALYTFLAILGLALIPIPGPNVFSFYPAALALGRYLALLGVKRARQSTVLSFNPEPLVDDLEGSAGSLEQVQAQIHTLEERFGVTRLEELLTRQ